MSPSDITPEIIATKIWKWHWDEKLDCWVSPEGHRFFDVTFREPEWTGPLLEKATEIGKYDLFFNGENFAFCFNYLRRIAKTHRNKYINHAIAGAILEAIGE